MQPDRPRAHVESAVPKNQVFLLAVGIGEWPKPNWYLFNRLSLMPGSGIGLIVAGVVGAKLWLCLVGLATAVVGTWLTMRRLTGRILAWVAIDTAILVAGGAVVLALHLSGIALWVVLGIPAVASDAIATALTGVREAATVATSSSPRQKSSRTPTARRGAAWRERNG
jgi:hypothetical protein